jgi:hypothetical protein
MRYQETQRLERWLRDALFASFSWLVVVLPVACSSSPLSPDVGHRHPPEVRLDSCRADLCTDESDTQIDKRVVPQESCEFLCKTVECGVVGTCYCHFYCCRHDIEIGRCVGNSVTGPCEFGCALDVPKCKSQRSGAEWVNQCIQDPYDGCPVADEVNCPDGCDSAPCSEILKCVNVGATCSDAQDCCGHPESAQCRGTSVSDTEQTGQCCTQTGKGCRWDGTPDGCCEGGCLARQCQPSGGFLAPCQSNQDCDSGYCIEHIEYGSVCTLRCAPSLGCPDGYWQCEEAPSGVNICGGL